MAVVVVWSLRLVFGFAWAMVLVGVVSLSSSNDFWLLIVVDDECL